MTSLQFGDEALATLAAGIRQDEQGASAHWLEMQKGFAYLDGRLDGLVGFGDLDPAGGGGGLRQAVHRVLQRRFRKLGRSFARFKEFDKIGAHIAARQGRTYNLDILRQVLTLAWLFDRVGDDMRRAQTILVIGDGFATFTSLMREVCPQTRVIMVNLAKTLLVDWLYVKRLYPHVAMGLVTASGGMTQALADPTISIVAVRADDAPLLSCAAFDMAINIASMQEMHPDTTARYFAIMRARRAKAGLFYCCNREEKRLPDGTVSRFSDYPWLGDDQIIVDELCPWHQEYYILRPPFYYPFDGPTRHRLVRLTAIATK